MIPNCLIIQSSVGRPVWSSERTEYLVHFSSVYFDPVHTFVDRSRDFLDFKDQNSALFRSVSRFSSSPLSTPSKTHKTNLHSKKIPYKFKNPSLPHSKSLISIHKSLQTGYLNTCSSNTIYTLCID